MSNLSKQNPLFLPVQYQGELYFTSQYFHQQYHANKPEGGKYSKLADFNRLIRSIETYQNYVDRRDIVDLEYKPLKGLTDALFAPVKSLFEHTGYKPVMLINATAQIALTHHLDDEVSKSISVAANESTAKRQPKNNLAPMKDAVWFLKEAAKMLRMSETSVNRGMQINLWVWWDFPELNNLFVFIACASGKLSYTSFTVSTSEALLEIRR